MILYLIFEMNIKFKTFLRQFVSTTEIINFKINVSINIEYSYSYGVSQRERDYSEIKINEEMCQIYGRCMSTSINLTTTNLCDYSHKSIPLFFV